MYMMIAQITISNETPGILLGNINNTHIKGDDMKDCNENTHTDRMDVSFEISLYEYGIVRNPLTNDTVFFLDTVDNYEISEHGENDDTENMCSSFDISIDDVREALADAESGYFHFIGSDREREIKNLDNNNLSLHIFSLNQYNGHFDPTSL